MTRDEAIAWFKRIQNGEGVDRHDPQLLEKLPRGRIAVDLWDDDRFSFGIEYGALIALMRVFDLKPEDLRTARAAGPARGAESGLEAGQDTGL